MPSQLAKLFQTRRASTRLSLGDLARRCGYTNISKGANRIQTFEGSGRVEPRLLGALIAALEIPREDVFAAAEADRVAWETWASEPIEPHLIVKRHAAFHQRVEVPLDLHNDRFLLEAYASDVALVCRNEVCLVVSRRTRIWFRRDGDLDHVTTDTYTSQTSPRVEVKCREVPPHGMT